MNNYGNFRNVVLLNVKIKLQGHVPEGIENCYSYAYLQTHKCTFCFIRHRKFFPLKASDSHSAAAIELTYSLTFI